MIAFFLVLMSLIAYLVVMHRPRLDMTSEGDILLWFYNRNYERTFFILKRGNNV